MPVLIPIDPILVSAIYFFLVIYSSPLMAMKEVVSLSARSDIASPVDTDAKPLQKKVIELTLQELSSTVIAE